MNLFGIFLLPDSRVLYILLSLDIYIIPTYIFELKKVLNEIVYLFRCQAKEDYSKTIS